MNVMYKNHCSDFDILLFNVSSVGPSSSFLSDEGPMLETLDYTILLAVYRPFYISVVNRVCNLLHVELFLSIIALRFVISLHA